MENVSYNSDLCTSSKHELKFLYILDEAEVDLRLAG